MQKRSLLEIPDSKCKTPRMSAGSANLRGRKEVLLSMDLLMLFAFLVLVLIRKRRTKLKIEIDL